MKLKLEARAGSLQPYLLLVPALSILVGFLLFPLIWNIYISMHNVSLTTILGEWKYVGFKNFSNLLSDPDFHMSLQVSLLFVGGSVALQFFVGMVLAVVLNQQIWGSNAFRALFIIPWTVSAVITGFSFMFINLILITMWSVNFFDLILVMTHGGPLFASTTSSLYMYRQAFEFGLLSKGAAAGFLLIGMNLVLAYSYIRLFRRKERTVETRQM